MAVSVAAMTVMAVVVVMITIVVVVMRMMVMAAQDGTPRVKDAPLSPTGAGLPAL